MQIVQKPAQADVTRVVVDVEAKPETFDLIGLTAYELGYIAILLGSCHGETPNLYHPIQELVGFDNDKVPKTHEIATARGLLSVKPQMVRDLLATRE
jgi:hypothetical protein